MRLLARKWICDQTPEGAEFECPDSDALILIELGLAQKVEEPEPAAPVRRPPGRPRKTFIAEPFENE